MTKFEQVLQNVTDTILGKQEEVKTTSKPAVGFTAPKKKRKYTRRKKTKK